jgi:hypothetical protein
MDAEKLARAALEGFFGSSGFGDMKVNHQRKEAVRRVQQVLDTYVTKEVKDEPTQGQAGPDH